MRRKRYRRFRKHMQRARMPLLYTVMLVVGLAAFLSSVRSCSETRTDAPQATGVRIVTEAR